MHAREPNRAEGGTRLARVCAAETAPRGVPREFTAGNCTQAGSSRTAEERYFRAFALIASADSLLGIT